MNRRDHVLVAEASLALVVANVLLGSVLDASPHAWVTAAWAVTFGGLTVTGLALASAAIAVPWTVVTHCLRRALRRTVPADARTRAGHAGLKPRPTRPAPGTGRRPEPVDPATAARDSALIDAWPPVDGYTDEHLVEALYASREAAA